MRATSFKRTSEPSAFARTMMSPNSSALIRRPRARTVYVSSLSGRRRLAAERARGIHDVLRRDRVHEVGHREAQLRDRVGRDPDAHGVVRRAEDLDLADPGHAGELVLDVDHDVVRQEVLVPRLVRRVDREDEQRDARRLDGREAVVVHGLRADWPAPAPGGSGPAPDRCRCPCRSRTRPAASSCRRCRRSPACRSCASRRSPARRSAWRPTARR